MAQIYKLINLTKQFSCLYSRINVFPNVKTIFTSSIKVSSIINSKQIHTTSPKNDLMEFFDDKKNWNQNEVKSGRNWSLDELRIKSNTDLHKLWFVLLKERNMLFTMEHECNDKMELFPSPERLDKVELSMKNLEDVVRERNKAYHMLETGETGERPGRMVRNPLGLRFFYREFEHIIPRFMNRKWRETHNFYHGGYAVNKFLKLYREKLYNEKRKSRNRDRNHVMHLLKRFPNMERSTINAKYPNVDVDKLVKSGKCRGHFVPE